MTNWLQRLLGETQSRLLAVLRRSQQTITSLAEALGVTDNAVRLHIADLRRHGLVADVGVHRETGGKPARLYGLTQEGEELFPKAYATVLGELVGEIARATGRNRAVTTLEAIGRRIAAERTRALEEAGARPADRVAAAAAALRELGADLEVQRVKGGWRLQGFGCPLSAVSASHPEVCALAQAIVADVSGCNVRECCDRSGDRPRCAFEVSKQP